ncbi:hypothetical protein WDV85_09690 [Pseudokineococcus sp. 5B2Z-1]|uniref:hypothetical protein n=1 Tax=Pseudokineococcus sp. 5B2Z-1 TaxID=3132744 RepID=UPI0030AC0867
MTRDDDLVEHLRHLARSTPPPNVDRAGVLRRGERRRAARASGVVVAAVGAVIASAAGVQALLPQAPAPAPLADLSTSAPQPTNAAGDGVAFDASDTTVTEPLDAWVWSRQELAITSAATWHYLDSCMAAAGLPGWAEAADEIVVPAAPQDGFDTYGLWNTTQADGDRYAPRPEPSDVYDGKASASSDREMTDLTAAVSRDCFQQALAADVAYDLEEVDAVAPAPTGVNPPQYTDDGRAVIQEWADCVRAAGVPVTTDEDPLRLVPDGAADATPDERQRMAAIDLGCKQQLGTTEAIAQIVAREQNAYIDRAHDHLVLQKTVQDRVLAASIAYLTEQGVEVPATD